MSDECKYKILLLGESKIGAKTSLMIRMTEDAFSQTIIWLQLVFI